MVFGGESQLTQLLSVQTTTPNYNRVALRGLEVGKMAFNISELVLSLDFEGIVIPKSIISEVIEEMKNEGVNCWLQ